ncbi:la-related protein 6A-like [Phragmites australis]|uniref:la-related protein 6A-like n=1 Tax=Phragmites australis TaxID=29695 RepID=UPI002D789563|nr:la-related protein 6A-like [Phragmites australis]
MDGQAPTTPLGAVAPEPLTVVGELQRSPLSSPTSEANDALPSGVDGQAPLLDAVAPEPPTVSDELLLQQPPSPLEVVEDALPVVPDTVDAISTGGLEAGAGSVVLTDELRDQIVKQVEYYFSDENLPTDEFLLKFVKKNKDGFVPIGVIASFRRMKKLVQDLSIIEAALRTSSKLVVSSNGKRIRRVDPLPHNESKDAKKNTVVVENLSPDFSMESLQEKFGTVGKIVNITIQHPHSVKESATPKKADFILSSKVHALVEYEAMEAAEKAVSTLNDERNWRTGMKVRLLAKRSVMGSEKHNQSSKENRDTVSKKNNQNHPSKEEKHTTSEKNSSADSVEGAMDKDNLNSVLTPEDEHQHQKPNAKGGQKGRYRGRQGQIQQNINRQGSSGSEPLNKSLPGPRMPDGTRGFTMGRGKSLAPQKSEKAEE